MAISQVIEAFPSFFPYFVWEQKYRGREIKEMELLLRFSRPLEEIVKCLIFGVKIYCKYFFGPDYVKFPFLFFCILSRARDIAASCFEIPFVFSTEKKKHLLLLRWGDIAPSAEEKNCLGWQRLAGRGVRKKISPFRWPRSWNGFCCTSIFIAFAIWARKCSIFLPNMWRKCHKCKLFIFFFFKSCLSLSWEKKSLRLTTAKGRGGV